MKSIQTPYGAIAVHESVGCGPPVVLIHGNSSLESQPAPDERVVRLWRNFADRKRSDSNRGAIINYGKRYRAGLRVASTLAESAVNSLVCKRMVKKQQMRWSIRGAHALLRAARERLAKRPRHSRAIELASHLRIVSQEVLEGAHDLAPLISGEAQ